MAERNENNNNNDTSTRGCRSKLESFLSTLTADTLLSLGGQIKMILPEEVLTGTRTTMPRAVPGTVETTEGSTLCREGAGP